MESLELYGHQTLTNISSFIEIENYIYSKIEQIGFAGVLIAGIANMTEKLKLITNFPSEFVSSYSQNNLHLHDHVIHHCQLEHSPIIWQEAYSNTPLSKQTQKLVHLSMTTGIEHCIGIPTFNAKGKGVVNLYYKGKKSDFTQLYHQKYNELVGLSQLLFCEILKKYPERLLTQSSLTKREKECLHLVTKGLTNIEISKLMSISKDRVKELVSLILKKFDAANRTEAAMIAVKSGIL